MLFRSKGIAAKTPVRDFLRDFGVALLGLAVVLTCCNGAAAQQTIWPSTAVPATVNSGNAGAVELGVSFKSDVNGTITGIRYYKSTGNTGTHIGHLWSSAGALLASVTFSGESASCWQQASFSTPVAIKANTVYVASYQCNAGYWSVNWSYFATSGYNNAPLHALQNGAGAPDGLWGTAGTFPAHTNSANYWIDVAFKKGATPSFTTQPASQTVTAGQTAKFAVSATGSGTLTYQWKKNGTAISGATLSNYTTPATTSSDNGAKFTVAVTNSAGTVTSNAATLTVNAPPAITSQPASKTVTAGQTATFSVSASGAAPLSYQWYKNGAALSGATAVSYTTAAATTADSGAQFAATVKNGLGTVTSGSATLTVNAATALLSASPVSLSFGSVDVDAGGTLVVTLKNSGTSNITISSVGTSGTGFNATGLSSGTVLTPGQTATLNANFDPTSAGSVTGNLVVASNATNSPATISLSGTGVQQSAVYRSWVMSSLTRVGQTDAPGTTSSISLSGARGETVDTQVIVQAPAGGLTNVNLSASALTGPNGVSIPASNLILYREHYITVTGTANYGGGSNPPQGSGTYPEPLIPFNDPETGASLCGSSASLKACNASISSGQNQPYWIDISVPHGATIAPPGTYTGTITITTDQGSATVPVSLTVWNFGLPEQPTELSLWTLWSPASGNTPTTLDRALMRNKVMGWYDPSGNASSDMTSMSLNRSGLDSYYYIGIQCNGSYSSIPSTSQIDSAAANFPAGLGLDFYLADELNGCSGDYSPIKTMGLNAHAANRSVKTMVTLEAPDPNLYNEGDGRSAVDHWVLLDSVQKWPTLPFTGGGSDLWSYTSCNAGYGNAPEWMMDYPPINERIQAGFLNWTQGAKGILYYRADGWLSGNTLSSWNNMNMLDCGGYSRPGDGIFVYPPAPIGSTESAPGIRLKAIRDGIQDYEYAHMLSSLGQLTFLNPIVLPIATSWSSWDHNPTALEDARLQLGQELHLLAPPGF